MKSLDHWLEDNIDELFYINNEEHYLSAIGVRGH